jgi:hypothetical protein
VRVDVPTRADLQALAAATEPVRAALARDPATAEVMRHLRATPGAGPEALPAPKDCTSGGRGDDPKPSARAAIPNGTYVVTVTKADYRRFGEHGEIAQQDRRHTMRFRGGRLTYALDPEYGPREDRCLPCRATYETAGDRLTIDWERPDFSNEIVRWSFFRGELTFKDPDVDGAAERAHYLAHPWRKVR